MRTNLTAQCRARGGYTLIEMSIVVILVALLAAFSIQAIIMATETYTTSTRNYLELFQEGRIALEKMSREIRETNPDSVVIVTGSISFTKQTGHDTPQDTNLDVAFSQSDDIIERQTASGDFTLVENVEPGSFSPSMDGNNVVTLYFTVSRENTQIHLKTAVYPRQPK